jgi:hypothetical protein
LQFYTTGIISPPLNNYGSINRGNSYHQYRKLAAVNFINFCI